MNKFLDLTKKDIKIFFSFDDDRIIASEQNTKIIFSNKNKYNVISAGQNVFYFICKIKDYLHCQFHVEVNHISKEITVDFKNNIEIESIKIIEQSYNICFINKEYYAINGIAMGDFSIGSTVKISVNGNDYRGTLINDYCFSINLLLNDLLLDNEIEINIYNEDGISVCKKNFSYIPKQDKKKSFSYYFSVPIKKVLNGEVFLFKNVYLELLDSKNEHKELINLLNYRNTVDGNISYIISLYLNAYMDNIKEFVLLINKSAGFNEDNFISINELKKIVDTRKKIQDNVKIDINLWNRMTDFAQELNEYTGIKYTKHTITNIFFTDYYQVYKEDIQKSIINLYYGQFNDASIFNIRNTNNHFLSVTEKHRYLLARLNKNEK